MNAAGRFRIARGGGAGWSGATPAERVLILLAGGLFTLTVVMLLLPAGGEVPPGHFALVATVPVGADAAARDADDEAAVALARPLFSAGRRPVATVSAAPTELPRLSGVVVGPGAPKAIFAAAEGGKPPVLGVGQSIAGHTIRSIAPRGVVLDDGTVLHPHFAAADVSGNNADNPAPPNGQENGQGAPAAPAMPLMPGMARHGAPPSTH